MKALKELVFEELSLDQKLGLATISFTWDGATSPENMEYLAQLIKHRALGGIWMAPRAGENDPYLKQLKELADYPLLVFTDAEAGLGEYTIGRHNAIGITDNEELAYTFGKVTAAHAAARGYNVVCNPVLDMTSTTCVCGGTQRAYGSDKYRVTALASAEAQGMHDGGCLTIGKHYPGKAKLKEGQEPLLVDSHMAPTVSYATKEDLLDYSLYPYMELDKKGLLDGVMLTHSDFVNIDPDYPMSLSKYGIGILREQGFEGLAMTDALNMMGVVAKYGRKNSIGLAVGNASAMALPFHGDHQQVMEWMRECYDEGIITDEALDEAVKRVLMMQHKVLSLPQSVVPTEEELNNFHRINTDSVFARTDDGVPVNLDRNGKYHFAVLTEAGIQGEVHVDTFKGQWYNPVQIKERLLELFPNAAVTLLSEFPTSREIANFLSDSLDQETVFITFCISQAYVGEERFTPRIISLMKAMQMTNRISTVLHFGNPFLLEDLPHMPRLLVGTISSMGVEAGLNVLAGEYPAKGVLTYDVKLK